jgi:hypothetical protein
MKDLIERFFFLEHSIGTEGALYVTGSFQESKGPVSSISG